MTKRPKKKRSRDHIPTLDENGLTVAIQKIEALRISKKAKQQLISMLTAASNPAGESIDVMIASLDAAPKRDVENTITTIASRMSAAAQRGRQALLDMDEEAFQKLVDEANGNN